MKKIKVIDLYNKIANDEEVPKKIKFKDTEYIYNKHNKQYYLEGETSGFYSLRFALSNFNMLNDEVEILEEKKLPEKLDLTGYWDKNSLRTEEWCYSEEILGVKINEIIDYLESKEKGE